MDPLVKRINQLAKKAKKEGLTAEETQERDALRRKYIDQVKSNVIQTLDNTKFVDEDGNKINIAKKKNKSNKK